MSTYDWKVKQPLTKFEKRFPIESCDHVFFVKYDKDEDESYTLFRKNGRWYMLIVDLRNVCTLRRATIAEYCSWANRVVEEGYDPKDQYFNHGEAIEKVVYPSEGVTT